MVNFALLFAVALSLFLSQNAMAADSIAAVANAPRDTQGQFSFAEWVDSIIANPETALKPTEAVQAFMNSMNVTQSADGSASNGVEKRWDSKSQCNQVLKAVGVYWDPAPVCRAPKTRLISKYLQVLPRC